MVLFGLIFKKRTYASYHLLAGVFALLVLIGFGVSIGGVLYYDRQTTHYPGAVLMVRQNIYSPAANTILWDDVYLTSDRLWDIQQWYQQDLICL